jgi:hypothetical protein
MHYMCLRKFIDLAHLNEYKYHHIYLQINFTQLKRI